MPKEWLDLVVDAQGQWQQGNPQHVLGTRSVDLGDATVRIHETARSAAVVLAPRTKSLSSYGEAAVYLHISFANQQAMRALSAPLHTPIDLDHVARLELGVAFIVGNPAIAATAYRAIVNAHCVYEKLCSDCHTVSGTRGSIDLNQSYNEVRAVDLTVLSTHDRVVESLTLQGLNLPAAASALVGARIYSSATHALLASTDTVIAGGSDNVTVSVPIVATLAAGQNYRVGFFVETTPIGFASGNLFHPNAFPYIESAGTFRINSAQTSPTDSFPASANILMPQMIIRARAA